MGLFQPPDSFPIKIDLHSFHFNLFFFSQKMIATGKESRLNNLVFARILHPRSLSICCFGHLAQEPLEAKPNCSFVGETLGKCPVRVCQFTCAFRVQSHISWLDQLEFPFEEKRAFLDWFQALLFTAVILAFSTAFFRSQGKK